MFYQVKFIKFQIWAVIFVRSKNTTYLTRNEIYGSVVLCGNNENWFNASNWITVRSSSHTHFKLYLKFRSWFWVRRKDDEKSRFKLTTQKIKCCTNRNFDIMINRQSRAVTDRNLKLLHSFCCATINFFWNTTQTYIFVWNIHNWYWFQFSNHTESDIFE